MFKLISCQSLPDSAGVIATYAASLPKTKDEPGHEVTVILNSDKEGAVASLEFNATRSSTEEESFEALASFLEQSAKAIRSRGEALTGIPIYS